MRLSAAGVAMGIVLLVVAFFLIYPIFLLVLNTFNVSYDPMADPFQWGLENWRTAFDDPRLLRALWNTFMIWGVVIGVSFPLAVLIAWVLARTNVPWSFGFELTFWVAYMMPQVATTIGWIMLLDPDVGLINQALMWLPFVNESMFNIFSVPGIAWAHLAGNALAIKVMLLTPAFRNMDASLEEAARISGSSKLGTMFRITLPVMVPAMTVVFALQLLRIFRSFEIEQLLGIPFQFFTYSTLMLELVRFEPPKIGHATILAVLTLGLLVAIVPIQKWLLTRRSYVTITGRSKPGILDLGWYKWIAFALLGIIVLILTVSPVFVLLLGSFMVRAGYFELTPMFTLVHWQTVMTDALFFQGLKTTLLLSGFAAIASPLFFSVIAYIIVRTRWGGRGLLDTMVWGAGVIPGMLSGLALLWLFLGTPGMEFLYGTIWALLIVVTIQGKTTGVNILKGVFIQAGEEMEEAARVSGAGWFRTYVFVWIPLMMPSLVLIGILNFVIAAGSTSSIILLASRETVTLSLIALELASPGVGEREAAGIISLMVIAMTVGVALVARRLGARLSIGQHTP